jgi:hypothetical protein
VRAASEVTLLAMFGTELRLLEREWPEVAARILQAPGAFSS